MTARSTISAVLLLMLSTGACVSEQPDASLHDEAMTAITEAEPALIAFRHDLHRNPELAGDEERTAGKVANALSMLGYDVRTGVGGHGVVAVLEGEKDGPLIAFRADLDAVAGDAIDPVPYASQIEGAHHICGHDMHTAIGIALAEGFAAIRDRLSGGVMLIFQPAEEAGTGAEAMLADGLFDERTPDAIFAVHTAPLDVGQLGVLPNGMMAGRVRVSATVEGAGDVDAAAARLREALLAAGDIGSEEILAFQTKPFVFVDLFPQRPARQGVATVEGFVMSAGIENRAPVQHALRAAVDSIDTENVEVTVTFVQSLEGVNNDPDVLKRASAGIEQRADRGAVSPLPGVIPAFSEDFGSLQRFVPGVMYFLGVDNPTKGTVGFPHSPEYVADDGAILVGAEAMLAAMLEMMENE